jgi:hypothetical protein
VLFLATLNITGSCAELEKEKAIRIVIEGRSSVEAGATLSLNATTENGTDSSYEWSSEHEDIATVGEDGVVTALVAGETRITAIGTDTGAVGSLPVVVLARGFTPPNYELWTRSGHADPTSESFTHWDQDSPAVIPTDCARCHSRSGFRDYLGEDGSAVGVVDTPAAIGSVVDCDTCHNDAAEALTRVVFPSGVELAGLGSEARCMTCHQGRASTDSIDMAIENANATDPDATNSELNFQNIHYYAAGATLNAGRVRGGYQYTGKVYDTRFRHAPGSETCIGCHDSHSLDVRLEQCATCHEDVSAPEDARNIRMLASRGQDYDGDGNLGEGIYFEVEGLRTKLLQAIQAYPELHSLDDICYDTLSYPYWFVDSNSDGNCDDEEASFSNQYASWTARLLRAAYNYQVASKDPGGYSHNAKYLIQLLYDSIEDLGTAVDLADAVRNDTGHFNGASEAARHWDDDEEVTARCSSCHAGAEGFRFYLKFGVGTGVTEPDNGLDCATCHESLVEPFTTVAVPSVLYPSGITIASDDDVSNMCSTCHRGLESMATIDSKIAASTFEFRNVHYLPAGAILQGSVARVGYEYLGKSYAAALTHAVPDPTGSQCTFCHDPLSTNHSFLASDAFASPGGCGSTCHAGVSNIESIRITHSADYDGDGNSTEPLNDEVSTLSAALLAQIKVAASAGGEDICYSEFQYPYFLVDTNGNGECDGLEINRNNAYSDWTAALMKAAHNYQISRKEPGAWAHNFDYIVQLLIDSIEDLGGNITSYVRP